MANQNDSNVATEQKTNAVEALAAEMKSAIVDMTEAQSKALVKLDMFADRNKLAQSAFASYVKGKFNYYRTKAKVELERVYDDSSKRGAKWSISKDDFVKAEMAELDAIANRL